MTVKILQGASVLALNPNASNLNIYQSAVIVALSETPPNANLGVYQGVVISIERNYEIERLQRYYPVINLGETCGCWPLPLYED